MIFMTVQDGCIISISRSATGESVSANIASVEPFRELLHCSVEEVDAKNYELCNADETGSYWKSLP